MRTSNKILLGIFIVPLLIITLINAALYGKYKSGSYVSMKTIKEDRFTKVPFKNISKVAVYGINNFTIIPADSLQLEIEKDSGGHLHYSISGDSLIIHGDTTIKRSNGPEEDQRSYQVVNLYLPGAASVTVNNSDITLKGRKDSLTASTYHFTLVNSAGFKIDENDSDDSTVKYFKGLTIQADHASGIDLSAHAHIADLQLVLRASAFRDNGASLDKLTIDADKVSNITLQGANLKQVNMIH